MGAIVRILVFVVGALGLTMSGLNGAEHFGVNSADLLGKVPGGVDESMYRLFSSGLGQLGGLLGGMTGGAGDADHPNMVAQWGPEGISGLISALLMMFSSRRS